MKEWQKFINYCPTCKHILGTHDKLEHLIKILEDVRRVMIETPELLRVRFNWNLLREEIEYWSK